MSGARVHGGPDATGAAPLDLSTNGNACGPCPAALKAVACADATRYPDPHSTRLRERLAAHHDVEPGRIVIAASGSEFILRITAWARGVGMQHAIVPPHAYADYAHAARVHGLQVATQPHAQAGALRWACDPGSPDGAAFSDAAALAGAGGVAVLDRAYEPLRLVGRSVFDDAPDALDAVWQLWSPNKALGLTGVRGAYAIAPRPASAVARELGELAPSWPLGAHGVAMLNAWCTTAAQDWLAASRATLREWRDAQLRMLARLGLVARPGVANFVCARVPVGDVSPVLRALRGRGVQLRDCASFGLPGHVRMAVVSPAAQATFARAWQHAVAEAGR